MTQKITISHLSDTHGHSIKPKAGNDIVVLSGDLCPHSMESFSFLKDGEPVDMTLKRNIEAYKLGFPVYDQRIINEKSEALFQHDWMESEGSKHITARGFKFDEVVALNGNHDFLDLTPFFPNSVKQGWRVVTVKGVKFGLVTGVRQVNKHKEWFDEIAVEETDAIMRNRLLQVDRDIDVLVTHAPPRGILDESSNGTRYGIDAIGEAIFGRVIGVEPHFNNLKAHLFGHVHSSHGVMKLDVIDEQEIVFSNASNSRHEIVVEI